MKTMNEAFDRYLKECVPLLGVRTARDYVRHVAFLREYFGDRNIIDVKPRDVGRFLDVDSGKIHRNKQCAVLSAVFAKAMGKWYVDDLDKNPCHNVERHESAPRTRYITDAEFKAVYDISRDPIQIMMDLALLTGQRQGDLLDLTWHHVQPDHIRIAQSKTGKLLAIRLSDSLSAVLQRCRQYKQFRGPRLYLVRSRNGEPFTHEGFRASWQRTMNDAIARNVIGSRYTFHDLRAKCASDKGDLQGASDLLGHETTQMTERVYIRNTKFVDPLR